MPRHLILCGIVYLYLSSICLGVATAPYAHPRARGGGFHLCELASAATRVGLSNFHHFDSRRIAVGP